MGDFTQIKQEPLDIKNESEVLYDTENKDDHKLSTPAACDEAASAIVKDNNIVTQIKEEQLEDEPEYIGYNDMSSDSTYQCDICRQHTLNTENLTTHRYNHTTDDRYTCLICYRTYNSKIQIYKHIHGCHAFSTADQNHEKLFKCDVCHKRFISKRYLVFHMRTHSNEKPHGCDICHKRFKYSHLLTIHMRTHTGERPYACGICHKQFHRKGTLVIHMYTHTGEKPHECNVCHKRFNRSHHLTMHTRTHTGEKPYECDICHKRFVRKDSHVIHMYAHTKKETVQM